MFWLVDPMTYKSREPVSCPICEAGYKPVKKYFFHAIKLKKRYKKIISKARNTRRKQCKRIGF